MYRLLQTSINDVRQISYQWKKLFWATISEKGSLGLIYTLVEIEKPNTKVITNQNNPSSGLSHAMKQIRDWKNWIEKNSHSVDRLFPSKFSHDSIAHIKYMLIVGKRSDINPQQELERIKIAQEIGYEIRSFDFITDNLKAYKAMDHIIPDSDTIEKCWADGLYHKFANPFFRSVSNKDWQSFASSPSLSRSHMIGQNIEALNKI
ncbi:MAG: DUF4263 domain-containing protein, partial [Proteobacteria bacterium]|nr:DUF4263 domain-containing protein [Pseudomonadota bacterium]